MSGASRRTAGRSVIWLSDIENGSGGSVGGKAAGLAAMLRDGERVPDGFCITTAAHDATTGEVGDGLREAILDAYRRLGAGSVAVRSSATTEDLPTASFAGQYKTVLNVTGDEALLDAVRGCWDSLSSPRAVAYRAAAVIPEASAEMAVVVQRMVDPTAAGVLFTANPLTGCRIEMVVDAVAGMGDVVVDGSVVADHYVLDDAGNPSSPDGCLTRQQLDQLRAVGQRLQRRAGVPLDVEWAIDGSGALWLLQARPITTLFPVPNSTRSDPRVFMEVGHMQGMLRPFTPMGMAAMRVATAAYFSAIGVPTDPFMGHPGVVDAAGRMYLDITAVVRYKAARPKLPAALTIYGPRVREAVQRVLADPRYAPLPGRPYRLRAVVPIAARLAPGLVAGLVGAVVRPERARRRACRAAAQVWWESDSPFPTTTAAEHLRAAMAAQEAFVRQDMAPMLAPIYAALLTRQAAVSLLAGVATESEVDETLRGTPHNVTTEMDLALWRLAAGAMELRDLLMHTPPADLAERYRTGRLPEIGLDEFLRRYGHRGAAEVDVGVPRWAEDPSPVFAAIAGYLRVTDPEQAADCRFSRAAAEATAKIDELVRRAAAIHPVRALCVGFLLRRSRATAGLRELPKFAWLHAFARMRKHLLAAGTELRRRGLLEQAEDVMFLDFREALDVAAGADLRALVVTRRAEYARELGRRNVPGLLLSDGTIPEAQAAPVLAADGTLVGMAAAAGTATGRARVVLDPASARVEPGEILVAPTTDPGWTPLFMTAVGLVTETGSPMAHGPTVAREYGIPAVICVRDATSLITTGQLISIDGAAGTVVLQDAP